MNGDPTVVVESWAETGTTGRTITLADQGDDLTDSDRHPHRRRMGRARADHQSPPTVVDGGFIAA